MMNTVSKKNQRDFALDTLKMLAALLVVFQHSIASGNVSGYLLALSRIAVPLFMMVTGFLYIDVAKKGGELKQIKRYLIIALEMTVLYFVLDLGWSLLKGNTSSYLSIITNSSDVLAFFFWNDPTIADHAWYMWAMIYTLLIVKLIPMIYKNKIIRKVLIISCITVSLVFGKYAIIFCGKEVMSRYTRNAWTVGIPFFLLGTLLRDHKDMIKKISEKKAVVIALIMAVLCMVERRILILYQVNASRDNYIFMTFFAISFFIVVYNAKPFQKRNYLSEWGSKYSLIIYVIHPLFVRVEYVLFDMSTNLQYVGFVSVLLVTFATAVMLQKMYTVMIKFIMKKVY